MRPGYKTMSVDGSAWDSTQFTPLAIAGPNKFFKSIRNV